MLWLSARIIYIKKKKKTHTVLVIYKCIKRGPLQIAPDTLRVAEDVVIVYVATKLHMGDNQAARQYATNAE